jgi:hypothetical protein
MLKEKLTALYNDGSKHSKYQNIPDFVKKELDYYETIDENWRGDTARYKYLTDNMTFNGNKNIGEIGANTGFFTLSLAYANQDSSFTAYEINPTHASFIKDVADSFNMGNVFVKAQGVDFNGISDMDKHDILLNYNVLHHAGVDFDTHLLSSEKDFEDYSVEYLRKLKEKTGLMVFQMGSNWGGNKQKPIVPLSDDAEKIGLNARMFKKSGWEIIDISIHTRKNGILEYKAIEKEVVDLINNCTIGEETSVVNEKVDLSELPSLSEFYRRSIFVVKSI